MSDVIVYKANDDEVKLSPDIVRRSLVRGGGNVSDQEVDMFLQLCRYQRLNPWLNEAYLVKYGGNNPATIVVGKEAYFKRAESHDQYDGIESGLYVTDENGQLQKREGAFFLPTDELVGGWARVYRKDRGRPYEAHVRLDEYLGRKKDGEINNQWRTKPGTMVLKVAEVQALRKAFPQEIGGLYDAVEVDGGERDMTPETNDMEAHRNEFLEELRGWRNKGALADDDIDAAEKYLAVAKDLEHLKQGIEKLTPRIKEKVHAWSEANKVDVDYEVVDDGDEPAADSDYPEEMF